jgi:hypothetical protein
MHIKSDCTIVLEHACHGVPDIVLQGIDAVVVLGVGLPEPDACDVRVRAIVGKVQRPHLPLKGEISHICR